MPHDDDQYDLNEHRQLFCDRSLVRERAESKSDKHRQDRDHHSGHGLQDDLLKFFQHVRYSHCVCPRTRKSQKYG